MPEEGCGEPGLGRGGGGRKGVPRRPDQNVCTYVRIFFFHGGSACMDRTIAYSMQSLMPGLS